MIKNIDSWDLEEKVELISELYNIVDKSTPYNNDDIIDFWIIGSYCWGNPTEESDIDIIVEIDTRKYHLISFYETIMDNGLKYQMIFRDNKKTPRVRDKYMNCYDLSRYSLISRRGMINGKDDQKFQEERQYK